MTKEEFIRRGENSMGNQRNTLRKTAWMRRIAVCIAIALVFTCFGNKTTVRNVYANAKMSIDGRTDDWKDIMDILDEPEGVFDRIAAFCDDDSFNILFVVNDVSKWCYFQVYVDTDNNPDTGFQTDGGGYEFMIENGTIYRSDAGEWPDTEVGTSEHAVSDDGSIYEVRVPYSIIKPEGKTVGFHIGLLNDSWETVYKFPEDTTTPTQTLDKVTIVSDEPYISDFKCTQSAVKALTEPAMQGGAIASFSAQGGDGETYSYSFVSSQKNGRDNAMFQLDGDQLITNKKLLAPGEYKVNVKVKSGVRAEIKAFTIKVDEPAPGSITEEIFSGDMGEWFIVDHNEAADKSGHTLQASASQDRLFLMLSSEEHDMNTKTSFVLDTKEGGYKYFGCEGADYVIHAQQLYPVIGANRIGAPVVSVKEDYFDNYTTARVYLSDIETPEHIRVHAFAQDRDVTVPATGYIDVNASFEMAYEEGYVYPQVSYDAFTNPGMGWVCWTTIPAEADSKIAYDHSLAYMPLTWANLETSKGFFDWENVEEEYHILYWEQQGVQFVVRFVMDEPAMLEGERADETYGEIVDCAFINRHALAEDGETSVAAVNRLIETGNYRMDIPTWLFAELCDEVLSGEADNAGTFYNWPAFEVLGGAGFSPNYELSTMIVYHDACMRAIADEFDGKAAYIEMGSLGHWGELHTWPEADSFEEYDFGSGEFPGKETIAKYAKSYIDAFELTKVGIRESYDFSRSQGFGMFNDVFGQHEGSESFLVDISKCGDFWKSNFSGGEFASGDVTLWVNDDSIMQTLSYLRDSHTTWLGPCSPCDLDEGSVAASIYRGNIDYLQTKMGYRFRVSKVNEIETAKSGSTLKLALTFENEGLAPCYQDLDITVALVNAANPELVAGSTTVNAKTSEWMPGAQNNADVSLKVSASASGEYLLVVSMSRRNAPNSKINLAMSNGSDNMYVLYPIQITK